MNIRFAIADDAEEFVHLARQMHAESRFVNLMIKPNRVKALFEDWQKASNICAIVAMDEHDGMVGVLIAQKAPYIWLDGYYLSVDILYVDKKYRGSVAAMKMLTGAKNWAKDVHEIKIMNDFNGKLSYNQQLFAKLGFSMTGGVFSKWQ